MAENLKKSDEPVAEFKKQVRQKLLQHILSSEAQRRDAYRVGLVAIPRRSP